MLYFCLVLNICYQSSRSWGFAATSDTPWIFRYNYFSPMFQKEPLGGYLEDRSGYVGFQIQLLRPYTFRYILYKIGFWNHPEMSHCGIFAIKTFL